MCRQVDRNSLDVRRTCFGPTLFQNSNICLLKSDCNIHVTGMIAFISTVACAIG
jgi:hypothetical protein